MSTVKAHSATDPRKPPLYFPVPEQEVTLKSRESRSSNPELHYQTTPRKTGKLDNTLPLKTTGNTAAAASEPVEFRLGSSDTAKVVTQVEYTQEAEGITLPAGSSDWSDSSGNSPEHELRPSAPPAYQEDSHPRILQTTSRLISDQDIQGPPQGGPV